METCQNQNEKILPQLPSESSEDQKGPKHNAKHLAATEFSEADRERFWSNVQISEIPDDCWPWKKPRMPKSGINFSLRQINYPPKRMAYCLHYGDAPAGFQVLKCPNNDICCNPHHIKIQLFKDSQNPVIINERSRDWRINNPEKSKENSLDWLRRNPGKKSEYSQRTYRKLKTKIRAYKKKRERERYATDPLFKLRRLMRARVRGILKIKNQPKLKSTLEALGCSLEQLKANLERQFKPGMTWENHGEWEIDHRVPISAANTSEEIHLLSYYTNLQPLWKKENRDKSNKMPEEDPIIINE